MWVRMRIALIGNGPVSLAAADQIDQYDLVVRMNYARLCGAAGKRTDILVLPGGGTNASNFVGHGQGRAGKEAKQFAFMGDSRRNPAMDKMFRYIVRGRPATFMGDEINREIRLILSAIADAPAETPSTGATALLYLLRTYPGCTVTLFGFTHQGWGGHPWRAEAAWIETLTNEGKVIRAPLHAPFVKVPLLEKAYREIMRGFRALGRVRLFART
jgi:hypothetical protein